MQTWGKELLYQSCRVPSKGFVPELQLFQEELSHCTPLKDHKTFKGISWLGQWPLPEFLLWFPQILSQWGNGKQQRNNHIVLINLQFDNKIKAVFPLLDGLRETCNITQYYNKSIFKQVKIFMCFLNPWRIHTLFKYFRNKMREQIWPHLCWAKRHFAVLMLRSACAIFGITKRAKDSWILCITREQIYIYIQLI